MNAGWHLGIFAGSPPARTKHPNRRRAAIARETAKRVQSFGYLVVIRLNGEPHVLDAPLTIAELLERLHVDPRRVAVERNLLVVKKGLYGETVINHGDEIEIVNFVGGGA